ncbi:hypothetical protein F9L07_08415 [Pimelobacter simplex]|uniref:Uncharacterized protein n=1 Tax=Nocardioides simplex TaxID=2045 RepID=A0A7J5E0R4_NOCSI|nr:hypothetical protein [Pimelobacter simplex]KAB2811855.1 hypothetical protein F9L07_08415 [Pimelobacter simplex]
MTSHEQVVRTAAGVVRVRCEPRGAELRDLTAHGSVRWVQWFSAVPGLLSLVGLVLHHTRYRRGWRVVGQEDGPHGHRLVLDRPSEQTAAADAARLVAWLADGRRLHDFPLTAP